MKANIIIDFEQLRGYCKTITDQMDQVGYEPTVVVGISRGGLVPGVMMSYHFCVPFVPITWQTRDFEYQDHNTIDYLVAKYISDPSHRVLIVDDICDTGTTMEGILSAVKSHRLWCDLDNIKTAAVFRRHSARFDVNWFGENISTDCWIQFPQEETW